MKVLNYYSVMGFGRYRGWGVHAVVDANPSYLLWVHECVGTHTLSKDVEFLCHFKIGGGLVKQANLEMGSVEDHL